MSNYTLTEDQQQIAQECRTLLEQEAAALGYPDIEWSVRGVVHHALETLREKTKSEAHADRRTRRPGKLDGSVQATFHTGEAVALVDGRSGKAGKKRIHGLKSFAKRANMLMSASDQGDPFADYSLAEIHNRLEGLAAFITEKARGLRELADSRLDPRVQSVDRVAFQPTTWSVDPVKEDFHFGHYASRALYCLTQYDELVLLCKGLHYHHIITHDECYRIIAEAGSRIRGLFAMGNTYRYWGCTWEDLRDRTPRGLDAVNNLKASGFIDPAAFNDDEEICSTFAVQGFAPHSHLNENQ